jgi:hypothetical protein
VKANTEEKKRKKKGREKWLKFYRTWRKRKEEKGKRKGESVAKRKVIVNVLLCMDFTLTTVHFEMSALNA